MPDMSNEDRVTYALEVLERENISKEEIQYTAESGDMEKALDLAKARVAKPIFRMTGYEILEKKLEAKNEFIQAVHGLAEFISSKDAPLESYLGPFSTMIKEVVNAPTAPSLKEVVDKVLEQAVEKNKPD